MSSISEFLIIFFCPFYFYELFFYFSHLVFKFQLLFVYIQYGIFDNFIAEEKIDESSKYKN